MLGEVIYYGFPFNAKPPGLYEKRALTTESTEVTEIFQYFFLSALRDLSGKKPLRKTLLEITHKKRCEIV